MYQQQQYSGAGPAPISSRGGGGYARRDDSVPSMRGYSASPETERSISRRNNNNFNYNSSNTHYDQQYGSSNNNPHADRGYSDPQKLSSSAAAYHQSMAPSPLRYGPPYATDFVQYSNTLADGSLAAHVAAGGDPRDEALLSAPPPRANVKNGGGGGGGLLAYNPQRDGSSSVARRPSESQQRQQQQHNEDEQQYYHYLQQQQQGGRGGKSVSPMPPHTSSNSNYHQNHQNNGAQQRGHSIAVGGDTPTVVHGRSVESNSHHHHHHPQHHPHHPQQTHHYQQQQQQGQQGRGGGGVSFVDHAVGSSPPRGAGGMGAAGSIYQQPNQQQYNHHHHSYPSDRAGPSTATASSSSWHHSTTSSSSYFGSVNKANPNAMDSDMTSAQLKAAEQARVRWAFSVDRTSRVQQPLMNAISSGTIREDLVDVVRLLSSVTNEVQTTGEASYVAATRGVNFQGSGRGGGGGGDDDEDEEEFVYDAEGNIVGKRRSNGGGGGAMQGEHLRSIGVQSGLGLNRSNNGTQVVEGDIASTAPTAQLDYDKIIALQQQREDEENGVGGDGMLLTDVVPPGHLVRYEDAGIGPDGTLMQRRVVAVNPSAYAPFCSLTPEEYPVYLAEARRTGVANRYGFVSLPRPPVELPPRRRVRAVQPTQYPHLHGRHALALDETSTSQLTRAYSLWIQGTGFVPKY